LSEQKKYEKEITKLKDMIVHEVYIENQKPLIDTLASYGEPAKPVLIDLISKLENVQLREYALKKLDTMH
jgi:hypothetical protein